MSCLWSILPCLDWTQQPSPDTQQIIKKPVSFNSIFSHFFDDTFVNTTCVMCMKVELCYLEAFNYMYKKCTCTYVVILVQLLIYVHVCITYANYDFCRNKICMWIRDWIAKMHCSCSCYQSNCFTLVSCELSLLTSIVVCLWVDLKIGFKILTSHNKVKQFSTYGRAQSYALFIIQLTVVQEYPG